MVEPIVDVLAIVEVCRVARNHVWRECCDGEIVLGDLGGCQTETG